ncbi:MAG: type III pantothenate kinase [Anaerotardibacter sp.]
MLLAIDVGNTQTVLGVYDKDSLVHMWRIATNVDYTSDELRIKIHALLHAEDLKEECIDGAILASVVPNLTHNWEKVCQRAFGVELKVVSSSTCAHLLNIEKTEFPELGADRVADAIAAKYLYGSPVVVVDFGTATNIEVIDKEGSFVGGIIAPGVDTSMRSLYARAALLRAVELDDPGVAIGKNTTDAVKVGVVVGEAARIDGLISRIEKELGYKPKVVATGGLAHRIAPVSESISEVNLELTLQGLLRIYHELMN